MKNLNCFKCGKDCSDIACGGNILKIDGKVVCRECFKNYIEDKENHRLGKYIFEPYIPAFCTGFEKEAKVFDNEKDLLDFLESQKLEDYIVACGKDTKDYYTILNVSKNGKDWYVRGYVYTDNKIDLPDWRKLQKVF